MLDDLIFQASVLPQLLQQVAVHHHPICLATHFRETIKKANVRPLALSSTPLALTKIVDDKYSAGHLTCNELTPDQVIKTLCITLYAHQTIAF